MAARFYVGDGTSGSPTAWNSTSVWSATSGGATGASVPGTSDTVTFDGNSGYCTTDVAVSVTSITLATGYLGILLQGSTFGLTTSGLLTLTQGTLNSNGQAVHCVGITSAGALTRSLILGASTLTTSQNLSFSGSNYTFSGASSTIVFSSSASLSFSTPQVFGTVTFSGTTGNYSLAASNSTYGTINFIPSSGTSGALLLSENITVTGTLTVTGFASPNRVIVRSTTQGTSQTITANAVAITFADIEDVTGTGAANWDLSAISGLSGDCGGNAGITFTSPLSSIYFAAANANLSVAGNWFIGTGGTGGGGRVPLPQDTGTLDANSGANTYALNLTRFGTLITTNFTGTLSTVNGTCFGSWARGGTYTGTSSVTFSGRGSYTITTNGATWANAITLSAPGGTLTQTDTFTSSTTLSVIQGTWVANGSNLSVSTFTSNGSGVRSISMGSGTWALTGTGTVFGNNGTSFTVIAGTSTIAITDTSSSTKTFAGFGKTFNNITITAGGTGAVIFTGNNTFNVFTCTGPKTLTFPANGTQSVTNFVVNGSSGNLVTINSSSSGTPAFIHTIVQVYVAYVSVQDNAGAGKIPFYADVNSTLVSGTTNWFIGAPPVILRGSQGWLAVLNQLAGTQNMGELLAANIYAYGKNNNNGILKALNDKAGTKALGLNEVCNAIAGTSGLEALRALNVAAGNSVN